MANQQGQWTGRKFTRKQYLKRDIRSAQTRSDKSGVKVSLAPVPSLDKPDDESAAVTAGKSD